MPSLVVQLSGPWLEHVQPCLHQLYVLKTTFSWRPLPSFSLLIIHDHLPSDSCRSAVGQVFSFFVVLAYAWLLFDPCFLVILADNLGGTLELAMTVVFVCVFLLLLYSVVRNTYKSLGAFFCETKRLWFCLHTHCWYSTLGGAALWFRLTPWHVFSPAGRQWR